MATDLTSFPNQTPVRCDGCGLNHFVQRDCRKCGQPLPGSDTTPAVLFLSTMAPLPTTWALQEMLIVEALTRTEGSVIKAARMIGIGKTTMFRKMHDLNIPTQKRRSK
jgi:DNA-binding NtrC family response regulator